MFRLLPTIPSLLLCACSSDSPNPYDMSVKYLCDSGQQFGVNYGSRGGLSLRLSQHEEYWLEGERSASGSRFSNGALTFWANEQKAILMINEQTWQCHRR